MIFLQRSYSIAAAMHVEMVLGAGAFRTVSLAIDGGDGINAMQPE